VTEGATDEGLPRFHALVAAARRVTGSEAVIIALDDGDGSLRISSHTGLEPRELDALAPPLAAGDVGCLQLEFAGVLSSEIVVNGRPFGSVHALRRGPGSFDNEDLMETFAVQIGLSLAVAGRPPVYDEMLATWAMLDRLVLSAHSLAELGRALTAVIGPLFGDARIGVMIADRQRSVLQMMPGAFDADDFTVASHRVSFFDPRSNSARVHTTGLPYISNASCGDTGIRQEYVDVFHLSRVLTIPLGEVGVLHIADGAVNYGLEDLERAAALAPRIASIVELAATLYRTRREQRVEETICRSAVAVASGDSIHTVMEPALRELCEATEANLLAFVLDDAPAIMARAGRRDPTIEGTVIDEAGTDPGIRAYVIGPQRAGDPGWAAFYVPVALSGTRIGTLAALRLHGEPFARVERRSFMRMANVAALNYAAERYQQQRAELARLQERQRLGDDLHDDVAQILFAAQLSLDSILAQDEVDDDVARRISHARGLLIRGDTAIRTVIHKLSSPPAADIATRLASVVSGVEDEFSLPIHLHADAGVVEVGRNLGRAASDALMKAAREALVNAAKHAGPCRVTVKLELQRDRHLLLTITDDGLGAVVPQAGHHHGLASIRQLIYDQGGWTTIRNGDTAGTVVTVSLPADFGQDDQLDGDVDDGAAISAETVAVY
jgi:signal transduction histidine kinase